MRILLGLIPLLLLSLTLGCVSTEPSVPPTNGPTITTLPVAITTPGTIPMLDKSVNIARDSYVSFETTLSVGNRYEVEVVTDGAPVDLLVLDLANYRTFSTAFVSKSGTPWEEIVLLSPKIVQQHEEFKAPRSGKYRIVVENADYIAHGAVTTRDVGVLVRMFNLDG